MRNQFSLNNPYTCQHCCGSSYLKILEIAAESSTAVDAINTIASQLALLAAERREYSTRKLAELFSSITPSLALGDPISQQEKAVLRPDFSPHPIHREWSVSSGAVAPSEGTPCTSVHTELQGSYTQENQG
ncbi:hypothetical protein [Shewanella algae]|uniref:hypothetical protein n=1 Tax=Shewanella algae TaxID=38313 RepID=UPI0031F4B28E